MSAIDWQERLAATVAEGRLVQLVVSRPVAASAVTKATVRPIDLHGQPKYQWTIRRGAQEFHENLSPEELLSRVNSVVGPKYADLHWFAEDGDYTVRQKGAGQWQVQRKPATKRVAPEPHNRSRKYLIPDDRPCRFLQEVGVMLPDGRVKPSMYHKFRQINRYLEFLHDVYDDLPAEETLRVVDFGCGKSYLTFAVHHYLTTIRRRNVEIIGLDRKADVVAHCSQIAQKLECRGLRFEPGEIHTYQPSGPVHLAISLHACDTATDDALASALRWQSQVIFAVPCCQHELARLLPESTLPGLNGYGLLRDRFAAMATDALRARYLETQGYRTQVVEFIETEHTPKNVLLRAVRRDYTVAELTQRRSDYVELKSNLGVGAWRLDPE
ncbi:MAG: SAM-dependent methyltransferase [Planctomycetaceae bacterium]|nr:SAM-dependent methyltransferase [Planctomycetaceae bacterium]